MATTAETNILNIVGEQVTLTSTIFPQRENFFVHFDPYYKFPGITAEQEETLKKALQSVFHKGSIFSDFKAPITSDLSGNTSFIGKILHKFSPKTPLPPCEEPEKELIIKSLTHRFGILRAQVFHEKERDSVRFRELTEHAYRLRDFIDYFKTTKDCKDYDVDAIEKVGTLDDERIKTLLQQFLFLILQGQNPLKDYKDASRIKPSSFIQNLEKDPIGTEGFQKFIGKYHEKKLPVNPRIAKVLEVTELDLNAIQYQIDAALKLKIDTIINDIKQLIPDLSAEFWQGVDITDLKGIFDRLLERLADKEDEIKELKDELEKRTREYAACQLSIQEKEQEKVDLQDKITRLQTELDSAKSSAQARNTNSAEFQSAAAAAQKEIEGLRVNIATLQTQVQTLTLQVQQTSANMTQLESLVATKQSEIDALKQKVSECDELRAENERLKSALIDLRAKSEATSASQGNLDSLRQEMSAARQRISELENSLESTRRLSAEEKAGLETTISELREQLSASQGDKEECASLQTKLSDAEKTLQELQASKESDAENRKTLEQEKAELEARIATLAQEAAKCNEELNSLKEETNKKKELITKLAGDISEIQEIAESMAEEKENIESLIKNIASWIRSGATDQPPSLNMNSEGESKLVLVIDAVNELVASRSQAISGDSKSQLELTVKRNYCYLVFFTSYMIARHFTSANTTEDDTRIKNIILSVVNTTLYGKEIAKGQYDPVGVYKKMQKKISAQKGDTTKLLLDCLFRVLSVMEHIYISRKTGVYQLDYFTLDSTEESILQILEEEYGVAVTKILSKTSGAISPYKKYFENTIEPYWNQHSGIAQSDSYVLYLKKNINIHGDRIENNSITVVYEGGESPLKGKAYSSNNELQAELDTGLDGEEISVEEQEKLKAAKGFSYAFVFYLYLFVVRDFLNSKSGEIADTCPLPEIMKKL